MEFKYLVAQQKIEQLRKELKESEESQNSVRFSDAGTQIRGYKTNDKSCQTDNTEMTDFQSQTNIQLQSNLTVVDTNDGTKSKNVRSAQYRTLHQ